MGFPLAAFSVDLLPKSYRQLRYLTLIKEQELTAVSRNLPEVSERAYLILFHVPKHPDNEIKVF